MTTEELEALFEKHDDLYLEGLASRFHKNLDQIIA